MPKPAYTRQFGRDVKLARRRSKKVEKLALVIRALIAGERLDPIHRDHRLLGEYRDRRECHIESDWLLVYKLRGDAIIFERTGTHADLFE